MHRKLESLGLATALLVISGGVPGQDFAVSWNPRTGDAWIDNRLADINQYGQQYNDPFIDEIHRYYGAPRDLVSDLLIKRHWAPGDIYYACALAQLVGQPCRNVVDTWGRDHAQGWGPIAQQLGIQPGTPELQRLKQGFVASYAHWGRPIAADDATQADATGGGKGKDHDPGHGKPKPHTDGHGKG